MSHAVTWQFLNLRRNGALGRLLLPEHAALLFTCVIALAYGLVPLAVYLGFLPSEPFLKLATLTGVAVLGLVVGANLPLFDSRFRPGAARVEFNPGVFHLVVWTGFGVFLLVTVLTAPSIPLLSALQGAGSEVLSQERGDFLKGRQGGWVALLYISTFMVSAIVPYSLVLLFAGRSAYRYLAAGIFFLFCISFLAKALFLNVFLPLLAYLAITQQLSNRRVLVGLGAALIILLAGMFLAFGDVGQAAGGGSGAPGDYLSAVYTPRNPLEYFAWRAFAVPIFTATDTLVVHEEVFGGQPLMGATSSLLAALFGLTRINLERHVFEHQFGGWNDIANANAFYAVDAYANFGYFGVLLFSLLAGQMFRWFRLSRDIAFRSLWPLVALSMYNASMIGLFFSNGFLYMMLHAAFVRVSSGRG